MKDATLLATLMQFGLLGLARDGTAEVVVPVKVMASSNVGTGGKTPAPIDRWQHRLGSLPGA